MLPRSLDPGGYCLARLRCRRPLLPRGRLPARKTVALTKRLPVDATRFSSRGPPLRPALRASSSQFRNAPVRPCRNRRHPPHSPADNASPVDEASRDEFGMLHDIRGMTDHARHQDRAGCELCLFPDFHLVLVPHVRRLKRVSLRLHLESDVDDVFERYVVDMCKSRRIAVNAPAPNMARSPFRSLDQPTPSPTGPGYAACRQKRPGEYPGSF